MSRRTELSPLFPSNRGQIAAGCDHRLMGEDGYSGKDLFLIILKEELECNDIIYQLFDALPDIFQFYELKKRIEEFMIDQVPISERRETIEMIYWVARSNFVQSFRPQSRLSERVIFPTGRNESNGIEDAR
ncbi:MAG: hypothetical protein PVF53_17860, partial [Desulfobacterales bacterium]